MAIAGDSMILENNHGVQVIFVEDDLSIWNQYSGVDYNIICIITCLQSP